MATNDQTSRTGVSGKKTYFAPPERASKIELDVAVSAISHNPLVDGLMYVANGLFAVLNEQRQLLAVNESFLKMMGIEDAGAVLGLRPGEYIHCIHAHEMPGGCGTSPYCATCGAVIAIVAALTSNQSQERTCSLTVEKGGKEVDLFFEVRCCPLEIEEKKYVLMFLNDVSTQQQRANLEKTFFHDISNLMTALLVKGDLFQRKGTWDAKRFSEIQKLILRTVQELSMQQTLANSLSHVYQPCYCTVSVNALLDDLKETFDVHPVRLAKKLTIAKDAESTSLRTDPAIVERILVNMVTNALEATEPGGEIRVFTTEEGNSISFCVWNRKPIPAEHAIRIFKRNFTTKEGVGHGLGTYSMKFFGEKVLGGKVDFTTSEEGGTLFRLTLMLL